MTDQSKIHYKLAYNGKKYRFMLQDDSLFAALSKKVSTMVNDYAYELSWNDGESDIALETADDLTMAIHFAAASKEKDSDIVCVQLTLAEAKSDCGENDAKAITTISDPLSIKGFVYDYILWVLERNGFAWAISRLAHEVPMGAEAEHADMRMMCAAFESKDHHQYLIHIDLKDFIKYKVRNKFGFKSTLRDLPTLSYLDMVDIITFAGQHSLKRAKAGRAREINLIARETTQYLENAMGKWWGAPKQEEKCSWAGFMAYSSSHRSIYKALWKQRTAKENNEIPIEDIALLAGTAVAGIVIGYGLNRMMQ